MLPTLEYNKDLDKFLSSTHHSKYHLVKLDKLGKGAAGSTYTCKIKSFDKVLAIKQLKRNKHSINEHEALRFLRDQMLSGSIPSFYIFMYTCFNQGNNKNIIMEIADKSLDSLMTEYYLSTEKYFEIFERLTYKLTDEFEAISSLQQKH